MESNEDRKRRILSLPFDALGPTLIRERVVLEQEEKCNKCGLSEWFGQKIVLEFEHKDGNRTNNSRENLEALCPNCHSQTETWRGRNNKTSIVSDEQFITALKSSSNISQALTKLGLAGGKNYQRARRLLRKHFL